MSCCPQPISKTKQQRNTTSHLSVHGFCILDHSLLQGLSCCRQPKTKTKQNPTAHLPCMDHVELDQPISINAHIVVNALEPPTTLVHLNDLDACSPYQTPDATKCVQVHFDPEFYTSSEDDVSSRPAKSLTPSPVAAPESPFHPSRADAEIKFQVRQLLVEDHSPIFLNSLQGGLHIPEALRLFLGAGSHWQTRHQTSPDLSQLLLQPLLACGPKHIPLSGAAYTAGAGEMCSTTVKGAGAGTAKLAAGAGAMCSTTVKSTAYSARAGEMCSTTGTYSVCTVCAGTP